MSQFTLASSAIFRLRPYSRLTALALVVLVAACATRKPAPVEERDARAVRPAPSVGAPTPASPAPVAETEARPQTYTVKRGDMLYKIALDHGLDYRELAAWNSIENVNLIREGQVLRLTPPVDPNAPVALAPGATGVTTVPLKSAPPMVTGEARPPAAAPGVTGVAPAPVAPPGTRNTDTYKSQPKALKEPYSEQALRDVQRNAVAMATPIPAAAPEPSAPPVPARVEAKPEPKPAPIADDDDKLGWIWPATGKLVTGNSENPNLKGIDIAGQAGQPVVASAAGKVVYSGTGIRGYGKLIIVKHNATYLSAYAHNRDNLVKEGQQVAKGQKIAEMGSTDADQVKLHFEIRKHGTPMDPLKYLPPA